MNIKVQMGMVLNLDKCLACHTCSIPCKNAWTTAPGTEYMWFNNVETKPGVGYPKEWENQDRYKGGWEIRDGKLHLRAGGKTDKLANIFANPDLPALDDYYEPWKYDYERLTDSPASRHQPVARPYSAVTGKAFNPQWGSNWEDDLGGAPVTGLSDRNFAGLEAKAYLDFKNVFMMHLPRLCEHCLNPACVASCPSGAMYKRDEDGIVLVDQSRCRGWRYCVSGCPYKKVYFNWKTHRSEKCLFCYPRIEAGEPTLCAHSCVGRIRYVGVMLYDADRVREAASHPQPQGLYQSQLEVFLNPNDPAVCREAERKGISWHVMEAARRSPIRKLWIGSWPCRCIPNSGPCRWCGTCRQPARSSRVASKTPRDLTGCGFPSATSPTCWRRAMRSRCARRFPVCSPCAATCGTVNSSPRLPRRSRPCARIPIRREYWPMPV